MYKRFLCYGVLFRGNFLHSKKKKKKKEKDHHLHQVTIESMDSLGCFNSYKPLFLVDLRDDIQCPHRVCSPYVFSSAKHVLSFFMFYGH